MKPLHNSVRIVLYAIIIVVLIAAALYAHTAVRSLWKDVAYRQAVLQDVPTQINQTAALKKELDSALASMEEINQTIPTEDEIVDVIAAISREVVASGVSAQVPVVGATGEEVDAPPNGVFSEVRLHVVASGDPSDLASFLNRVEHLPYMLRIAYWKIDTMQQATVSSFTENAPLGSTKVTSAPGSSLEAEIALVIRKEIVTPTDL